MKANDVLTLANKAMAARRSMSFHNAAMGDAMRTKNQEILGSSEKSFLLFKEEFCTLMDCIAVVSRDAGNEFRREGFSCCDV